MWKKAYPIQEMWKLEMRWRGLMDKPPISMFGYVLIQEIANSAGECVVLTDEGQMLWPWPTEMFDVSV